jgi:hypothetical protein
VEILVHATVPAMGYCTLRVVPNGQQLQPLVDEAIAEGLQSEDFFVRNPGQMGRMILGMTANVDDSACKILAANADSPECIIEIADQLNACRDAIETLLGAPYSSIVLFEPAQLVEDFRAAAKELMRLEGRK